MRKKTASLKSECFVSENDVWDKSQIQWSVCKDLPAIHKHNNHYYCILHLPIEEKNNEFYEVFRSRLALVEQKLAEIDNLPEDEIEEAKSLLAYDFRYVCFPSPVNLKGYTFQVKADFSKAIFYGKVSFENARFQGSFYLSNTTIFGQAKFDKSIFEGHANFCDTIFKSMVFCSDVHFKNGCWFQHAKFYDSSWFISTTFEGKIYFNRTEFFDSVDFAYVEITESAEIYFSETKFAYSLSLQEAHLNGYISFNDFSGYAEKPSPVFLSQSEAIDLRKSITKDSLNEKTAEVNLYINYGGIINFGHCFIDSPKRIKFQSIRLRPSWFIDVDSREFTFTDVRWDSIDNNSTKTAVKLELKSLEENQRIRNSKQLFKIACRQLAENSENNSRFEDASNFRKMAMETEWLEMKEAISDWIRNFFQQIKEQINHLISAKERKVANSPTKYFGVLRRSRDFIIHGLYRITSFYGESWSWALGVLLSLILVIFPIIYTQINFQTCSKDRPIAASLTVCESKDEEIRKNCTCRTDQITFTDAIVQSLTTATLQNVEYRKPLTVWGELWIILEKIFAPLQAALLALAIRRKFMR